MKKLQTVFAAIALLISTASFATHGPGNVSPVVQAAFEKNFSGATNVSWERLDDFYFASFDLVTKKNSAAYNENGELVATSRIIDLSQLPLSVSAAINDRYNGYTVAKVVNEFYFEGQTSYYVYVDNSKQALKLKCSASGEISVESKTKK
jgi:hypothetical protein